LGPLGNKGTPIDNDDEDDDGDGGGDDDDDDDGDGDEDDWYDDDDDGDDDDDDDVDDGGDDDDFERDDDAEVCVRWGFGRVYIYIYMRACVLRCHACLGKHNHRWVYIYKHIYIYTIIYIYIVHQVLPYFVPPELPCLLGQAQPQVGLYT
jgi:hypothetical protein